jgi:hypothetical protein
VLPAVTGLGVSERLGSGVAGCEALAAAGIALELWELVALEGCGADVAAIEAAEGEGEALVLSAGEGGEHLFGAFAPVARFRGLAGASPLQLIDAGMIEASCHLHSRCLCEVTREGQLRPARSRGAHFCDLASPRFVLQVLRCGLRDFRYGCSRRLSGYELSH